MAILKWFREKSSLSYTYNLSVGLRCVYIYIDLDYLRYLYLSIYGEKSSRSETQLYFREQLRRGEFSLVESRFF